MEILFETLKGLFFFLGTLLLIILLKGQEFLSEKLYYMIKIFLIPGFLLICGVMIGYLVANIWINGEGDAQKSKKLVKSFSLGLFIGIVLSLIYIFQN